MPSRNRYIHYHCCVIDSVLEQAGDSRVRSSFQTMIRLFRGIFRCLVLVSSGERPSRHAFGEACPAPSPWQGVSQKSPLPGGGEG